MIYYLVVFLVLFLSAGFFAGSELAIMSLPNYKIASLLKSGRKGAKSLKSVKENSDKLLITILIGNTLAAIYIGSLATHMAIELSMDTGIPEVKVIGVFTGIVTFLLLIFGEIIPKSFALKNATFIALKVAPIYKTLITILYPLIVFIEFVVRIFSKNKTNEKMTQEDFRAFIDMGMETGTLEESEHRKIKSILEFGNITVQNIMTPREKVEAININSSVEEVKKYYLEHTHTHTRLPVYNKTIDKIDYFITIRDILGAGEIEFIRDLDLIKVIKVPLNEPIDDLFDIFQKFHKHIAIVVDKKGLLAGVITLENIVEELFGDIKDEKDS